MHFDAGHNRNRMNGKDWTIMAVVVTAEANLLWRQKARSVRSIREHTLLDPPSPLLASPVLPTR